MTGTADMTKRNRDLNTVDVMGAIVRLMTGKRIRCAELISK